MQADDIIRLLNLKPHPTCGYVKSTYESKTILPQNVLPSVFKGARSAGSVLYFMLTPETKIQLHKIHSDQMYHFYLGTPLEVLLCYPNNQVEIKKIGNDLTSDMEPQLFIPGDTFHLARLTKKDGFALLATTEWPGVAPEDVDVISFEDLAKRHPRYEKMILEFGEAL